MNGFKAYPDFGEEEGKINSMYIMHSHVNFIWTLVT